MNRMLLALVALALVSLACATGSSTPRPSLYPSPTVELTQTPVYVEVTTAPVYVEITNTPEPERYYCVSAMVAVYIRPSPSDGNYPITELEHGKAVKDLGGRDGDWFFVEYGDTQGWVHSDFLTECS